MSKYLTELAVELVSDVEHDGRGTWRLIAPLQYQSDVLRRVIAVPTGFRTDFASVPRWPLAYWLFGDTAHSAAVIHDYLYSTGEYPRDVADAVLREAMEVSGVPSWRRWAIWSAVRIGGGGHYGER